MYERMLDKEREPTADEFAAYCGNGKDLFLSLDSFLLKDLNTQKLLRFPYGNRYGWGYKYFVKNRHICDVFAEKEAFTVMLRLSNTQFDSVYDSLLPCSKEYIDNKYPCGAGGWIQYRVLTKGHLEDIKLILRQKVG